MQGTPRSAGSRPFVCRRPTTDGHAPECSPGSEPRGPGELGARRGQPLRARMHGQDVEDQARAVRRPPHRLLGEPRLDGDDRRGRSSRDVVVGQRGRRGAQRSQQGDAGQDERERHPRHPASGQRGGEQRERAGRQQEGGRGGTPRGSRDAGGERGGGRQQRRGRQDALSHAR